MVMSWISASSAATGFPREKRSSPSLTPLPGAITFAPWCHERREGSTPVLPVEKRSVPSVLVEQHLRRFLIGQDRMHLDPNRLWVCCLNERGASTLAHVVPAAQHLYPSRRSASRLLEPFQSGFI